MAALSIPIIVHLFNFRRTRTVYFSDVRLLRVAMQTTRRQREIRHWLVLAARLLFIFFLVMAFAQPFIPATEQQGTGKHVAVYLDNSLSMSVPMPDDQRALDRGAAAIQSVTGQYPADTRFRLVTNDQASGMQSYRTGRQLKDQLASVRLSPAQRGAPEIRRRISDEFRPDAFLVSDFQRSAFPDLEQQLSSDTAMMWTLVPVQSGVKSNVYIDSAAFENPYLIRGEQSRLSVWIRNTGDAVAGHVNIRLTLNGINEKPRLSAASTVSIPAKASEIVYFDVKAEDHPMELTLSLQDFPVTYDNEFHLTYMPLRRLKVVHITAGEELPYIGEVFGNGELFDYVRFTAGRIGYDRLEQADVVIADGLTSADPALMAFAAANPRVVWLLIPPAWQGRPQQLAGLVGLSGMNWQPVSVATRKGEPLVPEPLAAPDERDPFFQEVFENGQRQGVPLRMPAAMPVYGWGEDRTAILRFRDGTPFLSRVRNKFLMACPLAPAFTDLGSHALFVPLMYRLAAAARQSEHRLYYGPKDRLITLEADTVRSELPVRLTGPREAVATQRQAGGKIRLDLAGLDLVPGVYTAIQGNDTLAWLAFNPSSEESWMETHSMEELREWEKRHSNITIFDPTDLQAFRDEIKERYLGTPLWKFAAWLAVLFLLAEVLLLRSGQVKSRPVAPQA